MDNTKQAALEEDLEYRIEDYRRLFRENALAKPSHCLRCRQQNCLRWHGSYQRRVITTTKIYKALPIKRILCVLCNHTFPLLPGFIEKFHHYAKAVIRFALKLLKTLSRNRVAELFTASADCTFTPVTLYLWQRKFTEA